jgi:hypothetical protein
MVISYIYSMCWHMKLVFYERQQASPSPSNTRWLKPLASFRCNVRVSAGIHFLYYFPWKSVTLAFKRVVAGTLGWYDSFCRGLNVALPGPILKVVRLGRL